MKKFLSLPYKLERKPLARGGHAEVYRATHRQTNVQVALKRPISSGEDALARLRREVDIQTELHHPNVMPILQYGFVPDWKFSWYTMPLADVILFDFPKPIDDDTLITIVKECALGLSVAHDRDVIHRDVTPRNIMRISTEEGTRWVVSDWGLVRRPIGQTTVLRTQAGQLFGTEGFAAPEMHEDAHLVGPTADIYSLGRVVAWALTDKWPAPNVDLFPEGHWRYFVQQLTKFRPDDRPQTMQKVLELLDMVQDMSTEVPIERLPALLEAAEIGDVQAADELCQIVASFPNNSDIAFDYLARLPMDIVEHLVQNRPDLTSQLVQLMSSHLLDETTWSSRSFDSLNIPLAWLHGVADFAGKLENYGLLEDATRALFVCEVKCQRFKQRDRTRRWLEYLRDPSVPIVARVLRQEPAAIEWYSAYNWIPRRAALPIRALFPE